jgi:hypothetical protein
MCFGLDGKGTLLSAELSNERSDITDPNVVSCAVDLAKRLKFLPSSGGMEARVHYSFDLRPWQTERSGRRVATRRL